MRAAALTATGLDRHGKTRILNLRGRSNRPSRAGSSAQITRVMCLRLDLLTTCASARAARHGQRTIGRVELGEPGRLAIWQVSTLSECLSLALGLADGATAPRQAAATTAATAATAAATAATSAAASAASAASAAAATSAATAGHLFTERRPEVLLVEDIERAEADVGDLFLGEGEPRSRRGILRRHVRHVTGGCRRGAARQRQRHANDSQRRYDFLPALSLRSLLRHCHRRILHEYQHVFARTCSRSPEAAG